MSNLNPGDLDLCHGSHAEPFAGVDVTHDDAVRIGQTIFGVKRAAERVLKTHLGQSAPDVVSAHPLHADSQPVLHIDIALEGGDIFGAGQDGVYILQDDMCIFYETNDIIMATWFAEKALTVGQKVRVR